MPSARKELLCAVKTQTGEGGLLDDRMNSVGDPFVIPVRSFSIANGFESATASLRRTTITKADHNKCFSTVDRYSLV